MVQMDEQRIQVLLEHWQQHNQEHANSYENWAAKLRESGWDQVAELLHEAARLTLEINGVLGKAQTCF
jgi:hypothetical protein